MDNWKKYLQARDDITDFYQVVWKESLSKTIKELAKKIKKYDPKVYEKLDKQLYEDEPKNELVDKSVLGQIMTSIFTHIKPMLKKEEDKQYLDEKGELKEPTESELYEEEKAVLQGIMPEFENLFNTVYAALLGNVLLTSNPHGLHALHEEFKTENCKIRYPKKNPYSYDRNRGRFERAASYEFLEFSQGVIYNLKTNRDFLTHQQTQPARIRFDEAERKITEPFTKIPHPGNYIMLANLSMSCVYEIIELMQIWIDSKKIASKK